MTSDWQRLSVRGGGRQPDGPYEGMPAHLAYPVGQWIKGHFGWFRGGGPAIGQTRLKANVASALRIRVIETHETGGISNQIFTALEADEELYLDCVDLILHLTGNPGDLASILQTGGSAWTVSDDNRSLERRVSEVAKAAQARASAPGDVVSDELREAWSAAYGRQPNASDAWDHAIKAVEDLLIPIVVPNMSKANLGSVAGEIKAHPRKWEFGLPANGDRNNGETLEGMLRHIWPNPDRHGGSSKRAPTQAEAEAAVHVAVAIVELCRGRLTKNS